MEELPSKLTASGAVPTDVEEEITAAGGGDVVELIEKGKAGEKGLSLPSAKYAERVKLKVPGSVVRLQDILLAFGSVV